MINIALFASGAGSNAENLIRYFSPSKEVKIKLVVSNKPEAGIVKRAELLKKNVQLISKEALNNYTEQIIDFLKTEQVDLIILAGFLLQIPVKLIDAFPERIINIHPSLLPKYGGKGMYGHRVHEAVLAAGEKESGISIHFVNEEYDKGAIILQASCRINETESPQSLAEKVHELEYFYFPRAIEKVIRQFRLN